MLHRDQRVPRVRREAQVAGDFLATMALMETQELRVDKVNQVRKVIKENEVDRVKLVHR